jgi:hypothetical protein
MAFFRPSNASPWLPREARALRENSSIDGRNRSSTRFERTVDDCCCFDSGHQSSSRQNAEPVSRTRATRSSGSRSLSSRMRCRHAGENGRCFHHVGVALLAVAGVLIRLHLAGEVAAFIREMAVRWPDRLDSVSCRNLFLEKIESGPLWRGGRCLSANLAMSDHPIPAPCALGSADTGPEAPLPL